jgi:hypothetical protein
MRISAPSGVASFQLVAEFSDRPYKAPEDDLLIGLGAR